jgi:hypothetical protein
MPEVARQRRDPRSSGAAGESLPVGGGQSAGAPLLGERQAVVVVHEAGAGGGQGVLAAELLPRPFELLIAELARPGHARESEVGRLREDHGVEQAWHVGRPSPVAAQRHEVVGEAGPAINLDQELGQIDLRQPGFDELAQPPLVRGLGGIDDQVAIGELRLGGRVAVAGELLEQFGLLVGEHVEALGAIRGLFDGLGELGPDLLPVAVGQQQT